MTIYFTNFFNIKKVQTALTLLAILLLVGVLGFKFFAGYTWLDALYMTVITVTTVGFGEVKPLGPEARIFTIFLILISILVVGYVISTISQYVISKYNPEKQKQKMMQDKVDRLKNHIIICGYGRNGQQAARKLLSYNEDFVVIDYNKEVIEKHDDENVLFVYGNATEDEVLNQAGVESARTLICALPDDTDNLFIVLSARQMNTKLNIISRASQETSYKKLKLAGANNVILPDMIGGDHMASLVVVPDLIEFIDHLSIVGKNTNNIKEIDVNKLYNTSKHIKTIRDLDLRNKSGCTIIGFKNDDGDYIVNPDPELQLETNSKIIVLGKPEQINILDSIYKLD